LAIPAVPQFIEAEAAENKNGERDRALVMAARNGDSSAFGEFYEAYRRRIWTLVVYWTGDPLQAQDVLQTIFLKAFRGLESFRFQSSLFTWLYRIARNECLNARRRRGAPHLPLEAILGSRDEIDPTSVPDGLEARKVILHNAVRQLPLKMREVVVLKYLDGLSYEEMSRALGCAPGTVASRLNRALEELGERLRPFGRLLWGNAETRSESDEMPAS
jgi:RNA polymerase sigma-70 factor (ECF subfamily)